MSFEHIRSSRNPLGCIFALVTMPLGIALTVFFGVGLNIYGIKIAILLGFILGVSFFIIGIYLIYQIIVAKEFTRIVSKKMIVFKSNGVITHQFIKDDIKTIFISMDETPSIKFEMKATKNVRLPGHYYFNVAAFHKELILCGYPVNM